MRRTNDISQAVLSRAVVSRRRLTMLAVRFCCATVLIALVPCGCARRKSASLSGTGRSAELAPIATQSSNEPAARASKAVEELVPYRVLSATFVGCRAPNERGCRTCCRPLSAGMVRRCKPWTRGNQPARYHCSFDESSCRANEPMCARCSSFDEQELATVVPLLVATDSSIDAETFDRLDECRDVKSKPSPFCVLMRWTQASANCQPDVAAPATYNAASDSGVAQ